MPIPVLYINLDSRPDRRLFMERQFASLGISAERVAASMPAAGERLVTATASRMSPSAAACLDSHRRALRIVAERGYEAALILEDDACLAPALPAFLDDPALMDDWYDVLRLETRPDPVRLSRPQPIAGHDAHRMLSSAPGAAGYIVRGTVAAAMLADPDLETLPIDNYLFSRRGMTLYRQRVFQVAPALCTPAEVLAKDSPEAAGNIVGLRKAAGRLKRRRVRDQFAASTGELARSIRAFGLGTLLTSSRKLVPLAPGYVEATSQPD